MKDKMVFDYIKHCIESRKRIRDERELINRFFELTEGVEITWDEIKNMEKENPQKMIFKDVNSEREFRLRYCSLNSCLNREYEKGLEYADEGIRINPESPYLHYMRGQIRSNMCMWEDAIKDLEKAIRLRPNYYRVILELAILYFNKGLYDMIKEKNVDFKEGSIKLIGDFSKAQKQLRTAIEVAPHRPEAYELLGRIYHLAGKKHLARQNMNKAMELTEGK